MQLVRISVRMFSPRYSGGTFPLTLAHSTIILNKSPSNHQAGWSRAHSTNILKSLSGRGMVKDVFPREHVSELVAKLESAKRGIYAGFDPTGTENIFCPKVCFSVYMFEIKIAGA